MNKITQSQRKKLLDDKKVVDEINRHKWLQSELAGEDIGFEAAAEDWLTKYAAAWITYHMPKKRASKGKN